MRNTLWMLLLVGMLMGMVGQGCSCDSGPMLGDLQVSWIFKETVKCANNVSDVMIKIDGLNGELVPCEEGTFRIPALEGGKHMMVVKGLDKHQAVTWQTQPISVIVVEGNLVIKQVILEPTGQGAVQLSWLFDGDATCPTHVRQISIQVDGNEGAILADCSKQNHKLTGLSQGEHNVILKGLTEQGEIVWKSDSLAFYIKTLSEAQVKVVLRSLKPHPGQLLLQWLFDGRAVCPNDVANIVIQIEGQKDVLVACTEGEYLFPEIIEGTHTITLLGLDFADNIIWESLETKATVKPNTKNTLQLHLKPIE